jgi:hypothetical protein
MFICTGRDPDVFRATGQSIPAYPRDFSMTETMGRTAFQMAHMREVASRPGFAHFCGYPVCLDEAYRGPFSLMWYTTDDTLHSDWVGQKKLHSCSVTAADIQ